MALDVVKVICFFMILGIPGVLLVWRSHSRRPMEFRLVLGWTLGIAVAILLAYLSALWHLSGFYVVWPVWCVACIVCFMRVKSPTPRPLQRADWLPLAGIALLVLASRLILISTKELPVGFDPAFHCLLAKKAMTLGTHFVDWEPFDPAGLNKPLGFHFLLAAISQITRIPLHRCFHTLLAFLGMVLTVQVYVLAKVVFVRRAYARAAAVIFGFLPVYGSLGYHSWGGVPNMLAMSLFLGIAILLCSERLKATSATAIGILFAGLSLVHNHVMLSAGITLAVLALFWCCRRARRKEALWLVMAGAVAAILGSRHYLGLLTRTSSMGSTEVLKFDEPLLTPMLLFRSLGYGFACLLLIGLVYVGIVLFRRRASTVKARRWDLPHVATATLVACFIAGAYLYRWYARITYGEDWVAFTPSRFLNNAVPFLSLYAAYVVVTTTHRFGKEALILGLLVIAGVGTNWGEWKAAWHPRSLFPDEYAAYQYVEASTPKDAIILSSGNWTAYLCYRRTMHTPLPITEIDRGRPDFHLEVIKVLENPELAGAKDFYLVSVDHPDAIKLPKEILCTFFSGLAVMRILPPESNGALSEDR